MCWNFFLYIQKNITKWSSKSVAKINNNLKIVNVEERKNLFFKKLTQNKNEIKRDISHNYYIHIQAGGGNFFSGAKRNCLF